MKKTTVHNPFDREPIAEVPLAQWPEIDGWLNDATSLHSDRSAWLPVYDRIAILRRAGGITAERAEELALQIVREGGKPLADARVETERAVNRRLTVGSGAVRWGQLRDPHGSYPGRCGADGVHVLRADRSCRCNLGFQSPSQPDRPVWTRGRRRLSCPHQARVGNALVMSKLRKHSS